MMVAGKIRAVLEAKADTPVRRTYYASGTMTFREQRLGGFELRPFAALAEALR